MCAPAEAVFPVIVKLGKLALVIRKEFVPPTLVVFSVEVLIPLSILSVALGITIE